MRFRILLHICLILLLNNSLSAQENFLRKNLYVEANYHYGFLMPHSDFISFFVREHVQGVQLNVGLHTNGEKSWHHYYNFPRIGLGYHRSGLGNREVYGRLDAIFGYVDRYYRTSDKKINFGNRLSFGGAYINKIFSLDDNSTNLAIGSHLNAYVNYSLETSIRLFPQTEFKLGAGITHVSNGNYRQPNKGLNFFTAFSGLTYSFSEPNKVNSPLIVESQSKHQFSVITSFGRKQISRKLGESYSVASITGEYSHILAGNSWGGASLSYYYDPSLERELILSDTIATGYSNKVRVSLNLVYELKMGRVSYVFQPGIYLKNPYKVPGIISNKLSVRYQLNRQLSAGLSIKAHWFAIADFFEWGIGYRWIK